MKERADRRCVAQGLVPDTGGAHLVGVGRRPSASGRNVSFSRKTSVAFKLGDAGVTKQQTATSEVLKVISSSPGELDPVFQAMLANATRICEANFGMMYRYDDGAFHPAALLNVPAALAKYVQDRGSFLPPPGTPLDRLFRTREVTYTADETAESNPGVPARLGGARSLVGVPMLKENELVGAIIIYRQEVRPFTDRQVELVRSFAARPSSRSRTRGC